MFQTKVLRQTPKEQSKGNEAFQAGVPVLQTKVRLSSGPWKASRDCYRGTVESGGCPLGCPGSCVHKLGIGPGTCGGSKNGDSLFKYQTLVGWEVGQGALEEGYPLSDTIGRQIGTSAQGTLVGWMLSHISLCGAESPVLSVIGFLHLLILIPLPQPHSSATRPRRNPKAAGFNQPNERSLCFSPNQEEVGSDLPLTN